MTGLVLYRAQLVQRTAQLADLPAEELRRFAVRAARDVDADALWQLLEAFVVTRGKSAGRTSVETLKAYRFGLAQFLAYAGERGVSVLQPRPNMGHLYVAWLQSQGLKPASISSYLSAAKNLYGALQWADATAAAPFASVRRPADAPRESKREPYRPEEIERMLAVGDLQDSVLILTMAHGGLRVSEMAALAWSDVHVDDPGDAWVEVVKGKGGRRRSVPVSRRCALALAEYRLERAGQRFVLPFTSRWYVLERVRALCARAGVRWERRQVHGLRHHCGTVVYRATRDLKAVQDQLGHKDAGSASVYVDYDRRLSASPVRDL